MTLPAVGSTFANDAMHDFKVPVPLARIRQVVFQIVAGKAVLFPVDLHRSGWNSRRQD